MSRSKAVIFTAIVSCFFCTVCAGQRVGFKPFMLFVTRLTAPPSTFSPAAFTERTTNILRSHYDSTSYQVIMVMDTGQALSMSNHKRDIIISSDPTDFFHKGSQMDTAVVWATFRTGFSVGRIAVPYDPSQHTALPLLIANKVNDFLRTEFLGEVYFEGGPKGLAIEVANNSKLHPPKLVLLPAGTHFISSSFPGFEDRSDTLIVRQGELVRKRIFLMPN